MPRIIQWDYREQPNWDAVNRALRSEDDPDNVDPPGLHLVPDTGSDQYALVVGYLADGPQAFFDGSCWSCRYGEHGECADQSCRCRVEESAPGVHR